MFRSSRWLLLALLLAGSPGCALYIEPEEGQGGGGVEPGTPVPTPPPAPTMPEPQPTPSPLPSPLPYKPLAQFDTAIDGNADGVHGCVEGSYGHYEHGAAGGTQLHVVGIYQAIDADGVNPGNVDIRVTRPGPSVLVLSAYEPTRWNVTVDPGAFVERIILSGYYAHSVSAPAGTPVESYGVDPEQGIAPPMGYMWPSYDTHDLVQTAQGLTGLELTSFRGCYASARFQIDTPVEVRPPHVVTDQLAPTIPAGCEELAAESTYCVSMSGGVPAVIGLDSGGVCQSLVTSAVGLATSSLGWQGDYVYGCIYDRGLARISLVDGSVDIAPTSCEALALHGDDILLMPFLGASFADYPPFSVLRFDDFDTVARREVADSIDIAPWASRMAVHGDRGYFAWHSTSTIELAELRDGAAMQSITLEGYDDWVMGLEATDDALLVLGSWTDPGLRIFDPTTGELRNVIATDYLEGLTCVSNSL